MLKSRKKMLLSSIAMLLVALIALGSATFAWYIQQKTVTADNATVSASVAEGLEIRKFGGAKTPNSNPANSSSDWEAWTNSITLSTAQSLSPASIDYSGLGSLVYADGGVGTGYTDGTLASGLQVAQNYNNFLIDHFQVASSGNATPKVYWEINNIVAPAGTYVAFAIYQGTTLVGSYTSGTAASGKPTVSGGNVSATGKTAYTHTGTLTNGGYISMTDIAAIGTKSAPTNFTVIGFVDGYDTACTSKNAKNDDVSISFTFSTDPIAHT